VEDKGVYRTRINAFAERADLVKMSDVDFDYVYEGDGYADRARAMLECGASLVVITRGPKGAQAWHGKAGAIQVDAPAVEVVDTIGAGDSFQAGLLYALTHLNRIERMRLRDISAEELRKAVSFACQCAAVTCMRPGADPPRRGEVADLIDKM
jgi:fructokinase